MIRLDASHTPAWPATALAPADSCGHGDQAGSRISTWLAPLALLVVSLLGALAIGLAPRPGQAQFAVIGAPWAGLEGMVALVAIAEGAVVDAGSLPNVIFAQSDSPDFAAAAYRAGAWLVLDPVLLRGCLGSGREAR